MAFPEYLGVGLKVLRFPHTFSFGMDQEPGVQEFPALGFIPFGKDRGGFHAQTIRDDRNDLEVERVQGVLTALEKGLQAIFVELKEGGGPIGGFKGAPMYFFPGVAVVHGHLHILLPALTAPNVAYGNMEPVEALIGADMTTAPIGLFLEVVTALPNHLLLGKDRKAGDARKIGGMQ